MGMRSVCLLLAAGVLFAQGNSQPAFEAAFVKANTTGSTSSSSHGTKGQLVVTNLTLKRLVERAYDVNPYQVVGPEWMENVRFDITAKYPEGTTGAQRPAMLRTLLEERFKLATHTETKELPGYTLVVTKGGLKIKPVEKGEQGTSSNSSNNLEVFQVSSVTMAEVATFFARRLGATVVDKTGAEGRYTFELRWQLDDPSSAGVVDRGAGEFAAIQEAIASVGLHLQATKVPVEIVVVDHIERTPTEN